MFIGNALQLAEMKPFRVLWCLLVVWRKEKNEIKEEKNQ